MEENTPQQLPEINPAFKALGQLLVLIGLYFMGGIMFSYLGISIAQMVTGENVQMDPNLLPDWMDTERKINAFKIYQIVGSLGSFALPALFFARFFVKDGIPAFFGLNRPKLLVLAITLVIAFTCLPPLEFLMQVIKDNFSPETAGEAGKLQENIEQLQKNMLAAPDLPTFLFNLFVIAVVPAVGEELFFRGGLMQVFYRLFGERIHIAVILSALLFAFIHFEIYSFASIFIAGVIFGYLYYWSGSIWVSIFAHFVFNGTTVLAYYLQGQYPDSSMLADDYSFDILTVVISTAIFALAMWGFHRSTQKYHPETIE